MCQAQAFADQQAGIKEDEEQSIGEFSRVWNEELKGLFIAQEKKIQLTNLEEVRQL